MDAIIIKGSDGVCLVPFVGFFKTQVVNLDFSITINIQLLLVYYLERAPASGQLGLVSQG